MNIAILHFRNPFSFFCIAHNAITSLPNLELPQLSALQIMGLKSRLLVTGGFNHGDYVAVLRHEQWARGVILFEHNFLIWLIDYGFYIRPDFNTLFVHLPGHFKKYPTKVFEAGIHGVVPLHYPSEERKMFGNEIALEWSPETNVRCQELIGKAKRILFVPVSLLSTIRNDIVLGDVYLEYPDRGVVNLVDDLLDRPTFLKKDVEIYIKNLKNYYRTRRPHHAFFPRAYFPIQNVPSMTLMTTREEYETIVDNVPIIGDAETKPDNAEPENATALQPITRLALTPAEMEVYAEQFLNARVPGPNEHKAAAKRAEEQLCYQFQGMPPIGTGRGAGGGLYSFK